MIDNVRLEDGTLYVWKDGTKQAAGSVPKAKTITYAGGAPKTKRAPIEGFLAATSDTIVLSNNVSNPSYITGLTFAGYGFELFDVATGAVKNVSGEAIPVDGMLSFNPDKIGGGGTAVVDVFSETSTDGGASWAVNGGSLRPVEISNSTEAFKSVISFAFSVPNDAIVRFRAATTGSVAFAPSSKTYLGQTVTGYSVVWNISRNYG